MKDSAAGGLQIRWIELLVAFWMTLVYCDRIVFEIYLFHPKAAGNLGKSLLSPHGLLMFLCGAPLFLIAFALKKEGLDRFQSRLSGLAQTLKAVLLDWKSYAAGAVALLLLALVEGMQEDMGPTALGKLAQALGDTARQTAYLFALCVVVYALWYTVYWLARKASQGRGSLSETILVWCGSGFFIASAQVLAILIYGFGVAKHQPQDGIQSARLWAGFLKDTTIYAIIALCVGSGLLRFEAAMAYMKEGFLCWLAYGWMASAALATALVCLGLDSLFAERVLQPGGGFETVWPDLWQRRAVHGHVYFRDYALLAPGILFIFGWLLLRVAQVTEEKRRSGAGE